MIQEIGLHKLDNAYRKRNPSAEDIVIVYNKGMVLANTSDSIKYPTYKEINKDVIYLFDFDNKGVFLYINELALEGYSYYGLQALRDYKPIEMIFIASTAAHLAVWYINNKYCGKCATKLDFKQDERALLCPNCGKVLYPTISPAIIVGVFSKDHKKILMTRYNSAHSSYNKYALVAGFTEIGEELEETVKREVKEETGLDVSDISYYKSQPWGFSSTILIGYTCIADEKTPLRVEENELSEAKWFLKEEMPVSKDNAISLTWDMIEAFRNNKLFKE